MIFFKKNLSFFLSILISLLISGCYSFYEISTDEYLKKEEHSTTKIILESRQELIIKASENFRISPSGDAILFTRDSTDVRIALTDINRIMEEDYDMGKTFFAIFWITLVSLALIVTILIQSGFRFS